MRYTNPGDGGHAMPTMGTFIQLLPKGFKTSRYRSTDATVFAVVEGRGAPRVVEVSVFDLGPEGHLRGAELEAGFSRAGSDAVIFSYSDRITQQKLGLWRRPWRPLSGNH